MSRKIALFIEPRVSKNNKPFTAVYVKTKDGKEIYLSPNQVYRNLFDYLLKNDLLEK